MVTPSTVSAQPAPATPWALILRGKKLSVLMTELTNICPGRLVIESRASVTVCPTWWEISAESARRITGSSLVAKAVSSAPVILWVRIRNQNADNSSQPTSPCFYCSGSTREECNLYTGQCDCRPGFGGRQCDQCEANFWGDPRVECKPCNCNPSGVHPDKTQCNPSTGQCECLEGNPGVRVRVS